MVRLPSIERALRAPLLSALAGIAAASGLGALLPPAAALPAAVAALGLASLSALLALDAHRKRQADALAHNVGELNVRLAATRIKLDGLQARIDSEPLREADIAPTRTALSELTAEVGLLGGVLRDVATAVSDHEAKLAKLPDATAPAAPNPTPATGRSEPARGASAAPVLRAETPAAIDAEFSQREAARLAEITAAFARGGLEVHLQPIAALPHRRTVGYEALARLRLSESNLLLPAEFIAALERSGQGASLDAQVLTQTLAIAGHLNGKAQDQFISLNLSSGTWGEARALNSIARVLDTYRSQAARLVIEVPQRTFRALDPTRLGIIGAMAANGVRFALDQVTDLRLDPVALADRGVRFVKAPSAVLTALQDGSSGLDIDAGDLASLLRRSGIELVGERAETDRQVADLIDLDIRLAQGLAISQPRPVKADVFQPAPAAQLVEARDVPATVAAAVPAPAPAQVVPARATANSAPAAEERVPLRAVLRRASA